jgi:heme-degrading monooxygenase HmoA
MKRFRGQVMPGTFAVIFTNQQTPDSTGYTETADRMVELAEQQPGFIGIESVRDENGFGITVSYWETEEAIRAWKANAEHQEAQKRGREDWYANFDLRICRVDRAYSGGVQREQVGLR